jgi:tetratricopeptide (TPR) repeat protein
MATFVDAVTGNPDAKYFRVDDSDGDEPRAWELEPLGVELLSDAEDGEFFVIRALHVLPDGTVRPCHMDMNLPERISDHAMFVDDGRLEVGFHHDFPGQIIPADALDCFGEYEQFYSRSKPEIGIEILKQGLAKAARKCYIAENLGYILRDEGRMAEAIEAFRMAVDEGPSSSFIYQEIAEAYGELGDVANQEKFRGLFDEAEQG